MNLHTTSKDRLLAALEGCYEATRAAALSGVPVSTVYHWARKGIVVPTVSSVRTKYWSYADLMALRIVYWLRHPKVGESRDIPASPMGQVREALKRLDRLGLDIWAEEYSGSSPLQVDPSGDIHIVTRSLMETVKRQLVMGEVLDLLAPFATRDGSGPDLIRPRPLLRIIPGKVSGEPHLMNSRITTKAVAALYERLGDVEVVSDLYPGQEMQAVAEAIDLERSLAA